MGKGKRSSQSGFTLLEVMVSIGILVGAILVISSTWSGNLMRVRKSNLYNNVASLLERKVTELRIEFKDLSLEEIPESKSGNFGSDYPLYRWQFKSQKFQMPDMSSVLIAQGQGDESLLTMLNQTREFIEQSVREATVTVFVKTGKKEVEFSVNTYFVDYNKEIGLGGQ